MRQGTGPIPHQSWDPQGLYNAGYIEAAQEIFAELNSEAGGVTSGS